MKVCKQAEGLKCCGAAWKDEQNMFKKNAEFAHSSSFKHCKSARYFKVKHL
jgi:hypothetical protein